MSSSCRNALCFLCAAALISFIGTRPADAKSRRGKRAEQSKHARRNKHPKRTKRDATAETKASKASKTSKTSKTSEKPKGEAKQIKIAVTTVLRARPGEAAKAVAPVDAGTEVRVIERDGRWIKVAAGDDVGWITRTMVERIAPAPRRRGPGRWQQRASKLREEPVKAEAGPVERATGGERVVVVAQRADVYARPSARALVEFQAHSGDELSVSRYAHKRRWVLVYDRDGRTGWIEADAVGEPGAVAALRRRAAAEAEVEGDESDAPSSPPSEPARPPVPLPKLAVRGGVDLGVRSLGMDFTSDVQAGLGNYLVSTQSATVGVGGEVRLRVGSLGIVGGDAEYRVAYSNPGIRYESSTGASGDITFSTHEARAGGFAGILVGKSSPVEVVARGGYHYDVFLVDQLGNVGRLPNESLSGPTAGVALSLPRLDDALALAAGVDVLLSGTRTQTAGLEDGESSDISAMWGRLSLTYQWSRSLELSGRYLYGHARTRWSGMSARVPDVVDAERVDSSHTITLALGASL